ncbi:MAG: PAS domain S-box protein [Candidatus Marinimicrobia bacterium]|nr:PAS domain S-box protein [Candidatus Neomarinimicrobiota bacterium]
MHDSIHSTIDSIIKSMLHILNRPNNWQNLLRDIFTLLYEQNPYRRFQIVYPTPNREGDQAKSPMTADIQFQFLQDQIQSANENILRQAMKGRTCDHFFLNENLENYRRTEFGTVLVSSRDITAQENHCNCDFMKTLSASDMVLAIVPILHKGVPVMLLEFAGKGMDECSDCLDGLEEIAEAIGAAYKRFLLEQDIRITAENLKLIIESTGDAIILRKLDGPFLHVNERAVELLGYTRDEFQEMHPEDIDVVGDHDVGERLELEGQVLFETVLRRKGGSLVPVEINSRYVRYQRQQVILSVVRDISRRKTYEKQIFRQAQILKNVQDAVFVTDNDFRIEFWNQGAEQIFGYTAEEMAQAIPTSTWIHSRSLEMSHIFETIHTKGKFEAEIQIKRKDGQQRWISMTISRLTNTRDEDEGYLGMGRDITERKQTQLELLKQTHALEQRVKELRGLYETSRIINEELDLKTTLVDLLEVIAGSWQYPQQTVVRIVLDGQEYATAGFQDTAWCQSADILVGDSPRGQIEVAYLQEFPTADEGPFLEEERWLINTLADRIARFIGRRESQHELQQSEEQYHQLFESMHNGFALCRMEYDDTGTPVNLEYLTVNSAFEHILKISRDQIEGKMITDVFPEIWETDKELIALYSRVATTGQQEQLTTYIESLGLWVEITAYSPEYPYVAVIFTDITEQKKAEASLREESETLRQITETSPVGITLFDLDGNIYSANSHARAIFGLRESDLHHRSYDAPEWKITDNAGNPIPAEQLPFSQVRQTGKAIWDYQHAIEPKDGCRTYLSINAAPLRNKAGDMTGVIAVISDISERRQMEQQLFQTEKMEAMGQIAGGIAHDFNNVLAAIDGANQMIELQADDEKFLKYLRIIKSSVERGNAVTNRMLTFTRSSKPEMQPLGLMPLLQEFGSMVEYTLPKDVHVHLADVNSSVEVLAESSQLQQVLFTLCINAADAMPNGGNIHIATRKPEEYELQRYRPNTAQEYWCLTVIDEGFGMSEEIQSRIFEPFYTTKSSSKGTGLGLAVVKKIMDLHDGWITVASAPGEGATFILGLPLHTTQEGDDSDEIPARRELYNGDGEYLLVVDDEEPLRQLMKESFTAQGYRVLTAPNGKEAFQIVSTSNPKIDLVLTDIGLPDINGGRLIMQIHATNPDLPVIAMTGYVDNQTRDELLSAGARSVVTKPFNIEQFNRQVYNILNPKPFEIAVT